MDTFKFQDIRLEKANASLRYRRQQRITTLFRLVELLVFLVVISRLSTPFPISFESSSEYFRGMAVKLMSPRFVFVVGNVIVIVLFLKSGEFSAKNGQKSIGFYDEYVEHCRRNQENCSRAEKSVYKLSACSDEMKLCRSHSEHIEKPSGEERCRELRRNATDVCRKSVDSRRKLADSRGSLNMEAAMSGEEFRRTVEEFIARQQRNLREEEEF